MRRSLLGWALFALLTACGCGSPGALLRSNAERQMADLRGVAGRSVGVSNPPLGDVGHRLGAFQRYAKNVDGCRLRPPEASSVVELMHQAFDELQLTGVELDVQTDADSDAGTVFVVHDEVDWKRTSAETCAYLRENTLDGVLEHWLGCELCNEGVLYIELKVPWGCWSGELKSEHRELVSRLLDTIERSLSAAENRAELMSRIHFVSFNRNALVEVNRVAAQRFGNTIPFGYHLILTSNEYYCKWLACFLDLPCFDGEAREFAETTEWLTGLWYSPVHMRRYWSVVNGINDVRRCKYQYQALESQLATYKAKRATFDRALERSGRATEGLKGVTGLIHDIAERE